ncbi:hypothetical protein ACV3J7_23455, partial [Salmonella enterica subsp. enterica serovar 3,10:z10:-]
FLAIDQIAQSGLSSLKVIYYSAQLFSDSKTSPGNTTSTPGGDFDISKIPNPFAYRPKWCDNWPEDKLKPPYFYQVCGFD